MRHFNLLVSSSTCTAAVLFALSASAHIELLDPPPRYVLPANKSCPCGDGDSNRRCMVSAAESTDPNRSATVTTFEAGQRITVIAEEYIDHEGRMRVAFDPDGADLSDFNSNILADVADPADTGGKQWEIPVTIPNEPCENCTLQVIQAMHGDSVNPVLDPAPLSTYYTCADIRIVPAGTLESGGETGGNGNTGGSANASGGAAGAAGAAGAGDPPSSPPASGGRSGAAGASASDEDDEDDTTEDSGCAFNPKSSGASIAWGALATLGLLVARKRRARAS